MIPPDSNSYRYRGEGEFAQEAESIVEMMEKAGVTSGPCMLQFQKAEFFRSHPHIWRPALRNLKARLEAKVIRARLLERYYEPGPHFVTGRCIPIGYHLKTGREVWFNADDAEGHLLMVGASGSGKTNGSLHICQALHYRLGIALHIFDSKGLEYWKFRKLFPHAVVVEGLRTLWNPFAPIGDATAWARWTMSAVGTWGKVSQECILVSTSLLVKIYQGAMGNFDPPSPVDVLRVFRSEGSKNRHIRQMAAVLECLVLLMGDSATMRMVPNFEDRFSVVIYRCHSLDASGMKLFATLHFNRIIALTSLNAAHNPFRVLEVHDENTLFQKMLATVYGRGESTVGADKLCKQRSTGYSMLSSGQSLYATDHQALANAAVRITYRLSDPMDSELATRLHSLPPSEAETLQKLPTGVAVVSAPSYERPVFVRFPKLEIV